MDRTDGVFVSRIALESAVYSSQCIVVGDEILAVNLVDVTRMSLDDVVIIMSIPRRLVLTTRRQKAMPRTYGPTRTLDHKPAPVVVFKGDPDHPHEFGYRNDLRPNMPDGFGSPQRGPGPGQFRDSRTLTWDRNPKPDRSDPKYFPVNSLPRQRVPNTTLSPPREEWRREDAAYQADYPTGNGRGDMPPPMHALPSYAPPPPVVTEQPRGGKEPSHFAPYKRPYGAAGAKPGEPEFYSPGYSQDSGGRGDPYMPRPSSRLLDPSLQSPYGPPDPSSYRKPAGPNSTGSLQRKSYTLGNQGSYRGARTRNFSGDARSHLDYASDTEAVQSPPRSLRNSRLRPGPHAR